MVELLVTPWAGLSRNLQQPNVIMPGIHNGCHIDSVFLYLIKRHIALAEQQLMNL